jgi:prepilin-type N-terminal cleavage/methylation domain-containing protein
MKAEGRRGFTLIEILVSLLILAVMGAVVAPAFLSERDPPDMVDAEGRLDALFRMARDSAVRSATPVTLVLDSASGLVWLDARGRLSAELPPAPDAASEGALRTDGAFGGGSTLGRTNLGGATGTRLPGQGEPLDLPASVSMELFQARAHFTFSPSGAVAGDSILLRGPSGEIRFLTLDPWSGRVRSR